MKQTLKKGFTLIELLIVIGILAVLATITVLVLNPAQLFAQSRDSQRISDIVAIRDSIALYLATVSSPDMDGSGNCNSNWWGSRNTTTNQFNVTGSQFANTGDDEAVDGTGWISIDFTDITGGSPLSALPIDPLNNSGAQAYSYACDNSAKTFEINAQMESERYRNGGDDDVESTDGGDNNSFYEVGSNLSL